MIDFDDIRLTAAYRTLGRPATLTIGDDTDAVTHDIVAIDKTAGVEERPLPNGAGVLTMEPRAAVRVTQLIDLGISKDDLRNARLHLNGVEWAVRSHELRPGSGGERTGEVYLILTEEQGASW